MFCKLIPSCFLFHFLQVVTKNLKIRNSAAGSSFSNSCFTFVCFSFWLLFQALCFTPFEGSFLSLSLTLSFFPFEEWPFERLVSLSTPCLFRSLQDCLQCFFFFNFLVFFQLVIEIVACFLCITVCGFVFIVVHSSTIAETGLVFLLFCFKHF